MTVDDGELPPDIWWAVRMLDPALEGPELVLVRLSSSMPVLDHAHLCWWACCVSLALSRARDMPWQVTQVMRRYATHPSSVASSAVSDAQAVARASWKRGRSLGVKSALVWTRLTTVDSDAYRIQEALGALCLVHAASSRGDRLGAYKTAMRYYQLAIGYQNERIGLVRRHRTRAETPPPRRMPSVLETEVFSTVSEMGLSGLKKSLIQGWTGPEISAATRIPSPRLREIFSGESPTLKEAKLLSGCSRHLGPSLREELEPESLAAFLAL